MSCYNNKLKEYKERTVYWQNIRINQLGFFNNLIIILATAFLAFLYKEIGDRSIVLADSLSDIDWKLTLLVIAVFCILFSVFYGVMCALSRLYDFRFTYHHVLTKQRIFDKCSFSAKVFEGQSYNFCEKIKLPYLVLSGKYDHYIKREECKSYYKNNEEINNKLEKLTNITHNLGLITWSMLRGQVVFFFFSILFFSMLFFSFLWNIKTIIVLIVIFVLFLIFKCWCCRRLNKD